MGDPLQYVKREASWVTFMWMQATLGSYTRCEIPVQSSASHTPNCADKRIQYVTCALTRSLNTDDIVLRKLGVLEDKEHNRGHIAMWFFTALQLCWNIIVEARHVTQSFSLAAQLNCISSMWFPMPFVSFARVPSVWILHSSGIPTHVLYSDLHLLEATRAQSNRLKL